MKRLAWLYGLLSLGAAAQSLPSGPLSFSGCLKFAEANNADLRAAEANVEAASEQEGVARSGFLPQIAAGLGYSKSNAAGNGGVLPSGSSNAYSVSLSATQNLFAGLQDLEKYRQAQANTRAAKAALQIARAKLSHDLKSAFEGLRYAEDYLKLTEDIIGRREANLRLVQLRFESGLENKGSVLLSEAYLRQARFDDLQAKNAIKVARAQLAQKLGVDPSPDLKVTGEVPLKTPPQKEPDFLKLATDAPEFQQALNKEEAAHAAVGIARSGFFPTLALSASSSRSAQEFFQDTTHRWSMGITLSIPLFSGGKDWFGTQSAAASWAEARAGTESVRQQVRAKLEENFAGYIEADAKLQMDESFRDAAVIRSQVARNKYNNGLITFDDWDLIENDLIGREKNYLQSKRDRIVSEATWEQGLGQGALP